MEGNFPSSSITALFEKQPFRNKSCTHTKNSLEPTTIEFPLGNIGLVLSKITSFLPHSDLKTVRKLSSGWNKEASRLLKKRSAIRFNFKNNRPRFFQYLVDMSNMKISAWEFTLSLANQHLPDRLVEDLKWFLEKEHFVHELKLEYSNFSATQSNVGNIILSKLGKFLRHLELTGHWDFTCNLFNFNNQQNLEFPKLKSLTFSQELSSLGDQQLKEQTLFQLLSNLIKSCPNLNRLTIPKLGHFICEPVFKKVVEFPKLDEIVLGRVLPSVLSPLLTLQNPLKMMHLDGLSNFLPRDFTKFQQLLEKNSNSLQSLKFSLKAMGQGKETNVIRLPKLPQLRYLNIEYSFIPTFKEYEFEFPGGLNYTHHFPKLQHLVLKATNLHAGSAKKYVKNDVLYPFFASKTTSKNSMKLEFYGELKSWR